MTTDAEIMFFIPGKFFNFTHYAFPLTPDLNSLTTFSQCLAVSAITCVYAPTPALPGKGVALTSVIKLATSLRNLFRSISCMFF